MSNNKFFTYINTKQPILIWAAGVSFVLFQFSLQLSSGVVLGIIMEEMSLSAFMTGLLASSFYFIYTCLQIPAGIIFDRKCSRNILTTSAILCSIGCLIFANGHNILTLFIGRTLIGTGSAFAFVGLSHLIRQYFPLQKFSLIIGASETLSFFATTVGVMKSGEIIAIWGWHSLYNSAAIVGIFIAFLCWINVPKHSLIIVNHTSYKKQLLSIISIWRLWINGLFAGLCFSVVTVFGAMWAAPFIQEKLQCSMTQASVVTSFIFIGTAFSCLLFSIMPAYMKSRIRLIQYSCISTIFVFLVLLFIPSNNHLIISMIMFLTGLSSGSYILAYPMSNELAPKYSMSTATGFTNTWAVISAPILQPLIGYILDLSNKGGNYELIDYQSALLIIPVCLFVAFLLSFYLPEKDN